MSPKIRLTKEQREEATRRVLAGETHRALADEFGCSRAYISLLKAEALNPQRYARMAEKKRTRKLSETDMERMRGAVRASTPYSLGLDPPLRRWDADHILQLSQKWFEKKPSVRVIKELLACAPVEKQDPLFRRPKPPEKHHISQLSREFAQDEDFVKYYLSPEAERLAWRQYELALADWKERFGDVEYAYPAENPAEDDAEDDMKFSTFQQARPLQSGYGQRVGKHAKGSANQKKRKKRKGKRR